MGDRVESIRLFDPETQRTLRLVESAAVGPAREMLLPPPGARELLARLDLAACAMAVGRRFQDELSLLAAGEASPDDAFYLPFLTRSTLLDFLPADALLVLDEPADIASAQEEHDRAGDGGARRDDRPGRAAAGDASPPPALAPDARRPDRPLAAPGAVPLGRRRGGRGLPPAALRPRRVLRRPPARPRRRPGRGLPSRRDGGGRIAAGGPPRRGAGRAGRLRDAVDRSGGAAAAGGARPRAGVAAPGLASAPPRRRPHPPHRRRDIRLRQAAAAHPRARRPPRGLPVGARRRRLRGPRRARHRPLRRPRPPRPPTATSASTWSCTTPRATASSSPPTSSTA